MTDRPGKLITVTGTVQSPCIVCGSPATGPGEAPLNPDGTIAFDRAITWGGNVRCRSCVASGAMPRETAPRLAK